MNLRKKKEEMKGSLTIEAALIIPLITFLILIVTFFTITIYSMIYSSMVINNATNSLVTRWNDRDNTGGFHASSMYSGINRNSLVSEIENVIKDEIDLKLPITVNTQVSIDDSWGVFWDYVTVEVKCDFEMPFGGLFAMFNSDGKVSKVYRRNVQIANSTEGLRVVKFAGNLADSITQMVKWKYPDGSTVGSFIDIIEKVKEGFSEYFQ